MLGSEQWGEWRRTLGSPLSVHGPVLGVSSVCGPAEVCRAQEGSLFSCLELGFLSISAIPLKSNDISKCPNFLI